jgi:hypothetical protein
MAKKKNSGYLKNFERNSGIGRNEKKNKKNYIAKNQMKVRAFKLEKPGNVRQSNRRRTVYSREHCTEQSVAVRARERREKEERETEESTTIPGPNRDRPQFPF